MSEIRFASGFSGIGGFDLGLQRVGFKRVWSCDIDKHANQIYTNHFGEENHVTSDIRRVNPETIPRHDLFCAGFPCQAFSVAGKRKGFKDTRGTLFFEVCRIAEHHRPSMLLLENVKGLLSHDGGRTFGVILESLEELGYWWEYKVLNSKHFGVPQNRERVFIIGHLRDRGTQAIFPLTGTSEEFDERNAGIAATLQHSGHSGGNYRGMNMILEPFIKNIPHGYNDGFEKELPNIKANRGAPYNELLVLPVQQPTQNNKAQHGRQIKDPNEDMFTLIGREPHGVMEISLRDILERKPDALGRMMPIHRARKLNPKVRIRRLTPVECERLQGFPDNWTIGVSDSQRYKCLGNAVTVNVIEYLGELIQSSFSKSKRNDQK